MTTLHIVFGMSAAKSLREALSLTGKTDDVAAMCDDLSFGPINPPDLTARATWVEDTLGYTDWIELGPELEVFWSKALSGGYRPVVWVTRRSTTEFCGFLEWLRRSGERGFEIVDLTETHVSTGMIDHREFAEQQLWDLAKPLSQDAISSYRETWERLRREDAPVRMLTPTGLESAALDVFDDQLLGYVGEDWSKAAYAVGKFLAAWTFPDLTPGELHQTGDVLPISRIAALIASGKLEGHGDPYELRNCTIRRRPP